MSQEIHRKLSEHEERMKKLEEIAEDNKKTFKEHSEKLDEHTRILEEHSEKLDEHTEMLKSLQRSMLIIEDAVVNKIPALFDGYRMHQEKQQIIEGKVEQLEERSQMNSMRISSLEIVSKQNAEDIAKLIS